LTNTAYNTQVGKNAGRRKTFFNFGFIVLALFRQTERTQQNYITCTLTKYSTSVARRDGTLLSALRQPVTLAVTFMKHLVIIIAILTLYSCTKQDLSTKPYFSFDNTAKQWFSDLKVNDTLKFLSNLGNVRTYRVSNIESTKQYVQDCSWTTGSCIIYFAYDDRAIYFDRVDSFSSPTKIRFYMFPPDSVDYKNLSSNVTAKVKVFGDFDDYNGKPLPNGDRILLTFPDVYQPVSFQTFAGATKTYNEVIQFSSNNTKTYYHDGWDRNYNINEVWYDKQFGFVYFKDIFGQSWVRQN
jgi:hypothetical protein